MVYITTKCCPVTTAVICLHNAEAYMANDNYKYFTLRGQAKEPIASKAESSYV